MEVQIKYRNSVPIHTRSTRIDSEMPRDTKSLCVSFRVYFISLSIYDTAQFQPNKKILTDGRSFLYIYIFYFAQKTQPGRRIIKKKKTVCLSTSFR